MTPPAPKNLRYQPESKVPGMKGSKHPCPGCNKPKQFTRYIDTRTGELIPDQYGICNKLNKCGYHLSPYHKGQSGRSFADEVYQQHKKPAIPKPWFKVAGKWKRSGLTREGVISGLQNALIGASIEQAETVARYIYNSPEPIRSQKAALPAKVCSIPDEVFCQSIGHYDKNQFARLLSEQFGQTAASKLLQRFHIGTSARWPGACVFWYIDEQNRKRGGQIKLFGNDWHTVKYTDDQGQRKSKTSWVHSALTYRLKKSGVSLPEWLTDYNRHGERSPCLFGLPQLLTAPVDWPVAIVESPKTAIICTHFMPDFIWLAVGALSYLNPERLTAVRGRKIILYPDLNAYYDRVNEHGQTLKGWESREDDLRANGLDVEVSDFLERIATDEQKTKGLDLADFLLEGPTTYSFTNYLDREIKLTINEHGYPAIWDTTKRLFST